MPISPINKNSDSEQFYVTAWRATHPRQTPVFRRSASCMPRQLYNHLRSMLQNNNRIMQELQNRQRAEQLERENSRDTGGIITQIHFAITGFCNFLSSTITRIFSRIMS